MTFLPIVERELRCAARRSGTYWSRFQAVLVALVPTAFLLFAPMGTTSPAQKGTHIFQVLSFIAFFYAIMSAVRLTADCLSSEKRDGTLGFLFLTDLKPYDVIFGKLAGTSLNALYGLIATLPVLAIPIMLGGVTLADLLRLGLVLVNTLFFALSLAMFVSSVCWQEKKAIGVTMTLLAGFGVGLPMVGSIVAAMNGAGGIATLLAMLSPGHACSYIASSAYAASPHGFWISTVSTLILGWMFLGLTCYVLPRVWQDRPAGRRGLRWREWCQHALMGSLAARTQFRRLLLDINPIYWLASRERRTVWYPWIFLACMGTITIVTCALLKTRGVELGTLIFCSLILNWFFKHWIINLACYAFSTDRDKGALELLLATPLQVREMMNGHWLALRRQFLAPVSLVLVIELSCFGIAIFSDSPDNQRNLGLFTTVFLVGLLVFLADLFALVWVGWWAGVVSKNAASAGTTTYLRVMILPWMITLCTMAYITIFYSPQETEALLFGLAIWATASLTADGIFGLRARRKLLTELRLAAVERYSGGDPAMIWWRRLGRALARRRGSSGRGDARAPQL